MQVSVSFVPSVDEVVEIRSCHGEHVILSHINYTHLERVTRLRSRRKAAGSRTLSAGPNRHDTSPPRRMGD